MLEQWLPRATELKTQLLESGETALLERDADFLKTVFQDLQAVLPTLKERFAQNKRD